jgi:hypothetical protein
MVDRSGSSDRRALVDELKGLVAKKIRGDIEILERVSDLMRHSAQKTPETPPRDAKELLFQWLDLNLTWNALLNEHGQAFVKQALAAAEKSLGGSPVSPPDKMRLEPEARALEIKTSAALGETAVAPFAVENDYPNALEVNFYTYEVTGTGHLTLPLTSIQFHPEGLALPPRGRGMAEARIRLSPDDGFEVGRTYCVGIKLSGYETRDVVLAVTVLPAAAPKTEMETHRPHQESKQAEPYADRIRKKPASARKARKPAPKTSAPD